MTQTISSTIAAGAPPRLVQRLRSCPDGPLRLVHRGPHAVYAQLPGPDGLVVGVIARDAAQVPCALRTTLDALPDGPVTALGGVLHLAGRPVRIGRVVEVGVPVVQVAPGTAADALSTSEVHSLIGAGDGLTPYGDDVLCGWLATHRAAGVPTPAVDDVLRDLTDLSRRTTLLSATLLDCAHHGEVLPEFAAWLSSLGTPAEPDRAARLAAIGHSSGRGLLAGARRALTSFRTTTGAAA